MRHIFAQLGSCPPIIRCHCWGSYTTAYCFVKKILQKASQMLPITINVCLNGVITCMVRGKSSGRWGNPNVPVPIYIWTWPVDMPACTLGISALKFWSSASLQFSRSYRVIPSLILPLCTQLPSIPLFGKRISLRHCEGSHIMGQPPVTYQKLQLGTSGKHPPTWLRGPLLRCSRLYKLLSHRQHDWPVVAIKRLCHMHITTCTPRMSPRPPLTPPLLHPLQQFFQWRW